ncbi:MAG: hypothetical protein QQW96_01115 [Tychonema bourrellyi B0820]|uniref:hypothetical protein n=1 Tax=Tychonema bourrellyi TaxID=54313 RepID=UPI0015D47680|nr:hypothetical protein [Tychonema bourrellyi]MDQ2096238.1 hypothetical protein [Tychonema bourrellyi B0820]
MCYGWGSETGFFPKYFVVTHRLGKKPGFLSESINPVIDDFIRANLRSRDRE